MGPTDETRSERRTDGSLCRYPRPARSPHAPLDGGRVRDPPEMQDRLVQRAGDRTGSGAQGLEHDGNRCDMS